MRCGGVGPSIGQGPKPRTGLRHGVEDVEQIAGAAGQPVEARD
jgi:hypothetical protein